MPQSVINTREQWTVTNVYNKQVSIGDLPLVPTLDPNRSINLLEYYTKEQIDQSSNLLTILQNGWFTLTKDLDGTPTIFNTGNVQNALATPDAASVGGFLSLTGGTLTGNFTTGANCDFNIGPGGAINFLVDEHSASGFISAAETPTDCLVVNGFSTGVYVQSVGGLYTSNNMLDDGLIGNMSIAGGLSINGGSLYVGNIYTSDVSVTEITGNYNGTQWILGNTPTLPYEATFQFGDGNTDNIDFPLQMTVYQDPFNGAAPSTTSAIKFYGGFGTPLKIEVGAITLNSQQKIISAGGLFQVDTSGSVTCNQITTSNYYFTDGNLIQSSGQLSIQSNSELWLYGTSVKINNKVITLAGNFSTSGAHSTTLTVTADSNVTLPTSGTLATTGANTFTGDQTLSGHNIVTDTGTGTKIGTLGGVSGQKLGFWNATPVTQPTTAVGTSTFTANSGTTINSASTFDGYTLAQVVKALRTIGLLA